MLVIQAERELIKKLIRKVMLLPALSTTPAKCCVDKRVCVQNKPAGQLNDVLAEVNETAVTVICVTKTTYDILTPLSTCNIRSQLRLNSFCRFSKSLERLNLILDYNL